MLFVNSFYYKIDQANEKTFPCYYSYQPDCLYWFISLSCNVFTPNSIYMELRLTRLKGLLLVLSFLFCSISLKSALCVALGNGDWNTAANWSCGAKPACGDSVVIPASITITITITTMAIEEQQEQNQEQEEEENQEQQQQKEEKQDLCLRQRFLTIDKKAFW